MYADHMSPAMEAAIKETKHRREVQEAYNKEHGITPQTVKKAISDILEHQAKDAESAAQEEVEILKNKSNLLNPKDRKALIARLKKEMAAAADIMQYELAAKYRDQIKELEAM